jgi:ribonuclease HI
VANRDLWEPFVTLVLERGDVAFQWVKGHSGHEMNDFVDQLAVEASRQAPVVTSSADTPPADPEVAPDTLW